MILAVCDVVTGNGIVARIRDVDGVIVVVHIVA